MFYAAIFFMHAFLFLCELSFRTVRLAWRLIGALFDVPRLGLYLVRGELRCRNGHTVPIYDQFCECPCGHRYVGSVWYCPGPSCLERTSFETTCPTCTESVVSPFRLGSGS